MKLTNSDFVLAVSINCAILHQCLEVGTILPSSSTLTIQCLCLLQCPRCGKYYQIRTAKQKLTYQSWGTKGSDKVSEDLGVVKSDDKNEVTVMVPTEQKDLNALYVNEMSIINSKPPKEEAKVNPEQKQEDYYKVSRSAFRWDWMADDAEL